MGTDIGDAGECLLFWDRRGRPDSDLGAIVDGEWVPSRFMLELEEVGREEGVRLIVLDNAACMFGGNEVSRLEVTRFCQALDGLALRLGCAILLLHHPAKAAGSEWSGSTAWEAAVRSRWVLERRKTADREDDGPERILRLGKANYATRGSEVHLTWHAGAFWPDGELPGGAEAGNARLAREAADGRLFLELLDAFTARGQSVSAAKTAGNYAPRLMARLPEAGGAGVDRLALAMEGLIARGELHQRAEVARGADRKPVFGLKAVRSAQSDASELWGEV